MEGFSALHWLALRSMDEDQDVEVGGLRSGCVLSDTSRRVSRNT